VLGIGGGGDVVGALATARLFQSFGAEFVLGGVSWERWPIDPHPGPRPLAEVRGGRPLSASAVLADERTTTSDGTQFGEARMAGFLCSDTVLVDISGGAEATAEGLAEAARKLDCDLIALVDVGGDALAHGDEEGLASPLCDAVMLAAGLRLAAQLPVIGAVYAPGGDGELSPREVMERISALGRCGALLGSWGLTQAVCEQIEAAAHVVPTEASVMGVRCARGETGEAPIRGGLRSVELTPAGGATYYFDLEAARMGGEIPLAAAVADAAGLSEARDALAERGIRTELDLEEARARGEEPLAR
jgi:hypothetical protein